MTTLLTKRQAAALVGLNPEHLMRMTRQGRFPKPIKSGGHPQCAVRFIESEVQNWIAERMRAREVGNV